MTKIKPLGNKIHPLIQDIIGCFMEDMYGMPFHVFLQTEQISFMLWSQLVLFSFINEIGINKRLLISNRNGVENQPLTTGRK